MAKRVLRITSNLTKGGTGNHVLAIHNAINQTKEFESFLWCPREFINVNNQIYSQFPPAAIYFNALKTKILGFDSIYAPFWTRTFNKLAPSFDILHLHHLQGYYFDIRSLESVTDKQIVLTVHDYWPITGRCSIPVHCEKWQSHCATCPNLKTYPSTLLDRSSKLFEIKRDAFSELNHLKVVALSQFMAHQLKKSFLKDKEIYIIPPGIDCNTFRPIKKDRSENINLGFVVAKSDFTNKGFDTLLNLIEYLDRTKQRQITITIVGELTTPLRTRLRHFSFVAYSSFVSNSRQLARLFNTFDLFLNFSRSETFGKTNIEAQACGVPILARDIPVFRENVKFGKLFDSDHPELLMQDIYNLLDKWNRDEMHRNMRENYHLDLLGERYQHLYRSFYSD